MSAALTFTGRGGEYFRIWVVNTLLTVLTLGIYSAWAKVRKASYFHRNTVVLGDCFEFDANPWTILRGRVLALALLGLYTFAFDFSLWLGLVTTAMLLALAPLFLASATRFRLRNTRWRAMRFDFTASRSESYRAVLIVIALWVSGSVLGAVYGAVSAGFAGAAVGLLLPWIHHRLKAFQHRHIWFAGNRSAFDSAVGSFYATYVLAGLIMVGSATAAGLCTLLLVPIGISMHLASGVLGWLAGILAAAVAYLAAWPYFATRIQRAVWTRTRLGPYSFTTTIAFRTLVPLALRIVALLLVTAGLYWPFATIAWARYRIGCMRIVTDGSPHDVLAAIDPGAARNAYGEGAADVFGLDIGW